LRGRGRCPSARRLTSLHCLSGDWRIQCSWTISHRAKSLAGTSRAGLYCRRPGGDRVPRIAISVNVALMLTVGLTGISRAAEIKCLFMYQPTETTCLRVAILGTIQHGDAAKLEQFLADNSAVGTVHLLSPGGDLFEGMKIGRLIRSRFLVASAKSPSRIESKNVTHECGVVGLPVCCASACALAYFGGIEWDRSEFFGLHRPTLRDLGDRSYAESQQALRDAATKIKEYLLETEICKRAAGLGPNQGKGIQTYRRAHG